jgi:hypothetical protein
MEHAYRVGETRVSRLREGKLGNAELAKPLKLRRVEKIPGSLLITAGIVSSVSNTTSPWTGSRTRCSRRLLMFRNIAGTVEHRKGRRFGLPESWRIRFNLTIIQ